MALKVTCDCDWEGTLEDVVDSVDPGDRCGGTSEIINFRCPSCEFEHHF